MVSRGPHSSLRENRRPGLWLLCLPRSPHRSFSLAKCREARAPATLSLWFWDVGPQVTSEVAHESGGQTQAALVGGVAEP